MTPTTQFVRVDESNVDSLAGGLSALHEAVRGERRDPAYWRWCCCDAPAGRSGTVVALRDGRVVGRMGLVPRRVRAGGERVPAGLYEGLAVLPEARSWRCLAELIRRSGEEHARNGLAFGYAFVTKAGLEFSLRAGSIDLGRLPIHAGFINVPRALRGRSVPRSVAALGWLAQPLVRVPRKRGVDHGHDLRAVDAFDAAFDDLWRTIEVRHAVSGARDATYLNWRYTQSPGRRYRCLGAWRDGTPVGLIVYRSRAERNDALVLELIASEDDGPVRQILLSRAIHHLRKEGIGLVIGSFPTGSAEERAMRALGMRPWAGALVDIHLVVSGPHRTPDAPERDTANWYFSLGDWLAY